jgi:hypothetical protein
LSGYKILSPYSGDNIAIIRFTQAKTEPLCSLQRKTHFHRRMLKLRQQDQEFLLVVNWEALFLPKHLIIDYN